MLENEMEDLIWTYPDKFLEPLKQVRRQPRSAVGRADLVFEDRLGRLLVIELKRGQLRRGAIDQVHDYFGMVKGEFPNKSVEMMVIAQSIPSERKVALDQYHIEYREISEKRFRDVALEVGYVFQSEHGAGDCTPGAHSVATLESDRAVTIAEPFKEPKGGRSRGGGQRRDALDAAVNAYNVTAEPEVRVRDGSAPTYGQICPPEWKVSHLHYEFYQTRGRIGAELHLTQHLDHGKIGSMGEFLRTFDGRTVANGKGKLTIIERHRNLCLAALFGLPGPPETVAAAMRDLISMTRSGVSERL